MTRGRDDGHPPERRGPGVAETTRSEQVDSATPPVSSPPLAPLGTWGGLRLIDELGSGSFGRVYRAWDDTLAREVALKIIPLPRADASLASMYLREGRMLARVRHHNVVSVYGALHQGAEIGLWMELIRGRRLADIVREDGAMSADEATVVGISLCHALSAVHGAGVLHRDLKAHNVMREEGGRIVLMDFGAGRDAAALPGTGDYSGTPLYMAPEVLAGREASTASDVYSLGVLLYFLVSGQYPVEGRTATEIAAAHGLGRRRPLIDRRPDLPDHFVRVVERAIDPSLRRRYATAGAMLDDLARAVAGLSPERRAELLPQTAGQTVAAELAQSDRRMTPLMFWTIAVVSTIAVIAFLGFLTSVALDATLGRDASFAGESMAQRLTYGLRSMVAPGLYAGFLVVVARLLWGAARLTGRMAPAARDAMRRANLRVARVARRHGLTERRVLAHWLVAAQVLSLAVVCWVFSDVLGAVTSFVTDADSSALRVLRPDNPAPIVYRAVLSMLLVAMIATWRQLFASRMGRPPERGTAAAGVVILVLTLLMLAVPYRVLFLNKFERINYDTQRCYKTGWRPADAPRDLLLFCPDVPPPRNRIAPADDSRLHPTGITESIFTPPRADDTR